VSWAGSCRIIWRPDEYEEIVRPGGRDRSGNHGTVAAAIARVFPARAHAAGRSMEREGESQEYFDRFSPNGYALGVNIMIYAMTH